MSDIRTKQPAENILFDFDFGNGLRSGESITSVISYTDDLSALTFGAPTISGRVVQITVSGGTTGTIPNITIKVQTNLSPVVEGDFKLAILAKT